MNIRDEIREENLREIHASYYRRLAQDDFNFDLAGGIITIVAVSLAFLIALNLGWTLLSRWIHGGG